MAATSTSPLPIPFAYQSQVGANGHAHPHHTQHPHHPHAAHHAPQHTSYTMNATANANANANAAFSFASSSASSASSSTSAANSPPTPVSASDPPPLAIGSAKVKSSAAKRASAKAAAATKKAAAAAAAAATKKEPGEGSTTPVAAAANARGRESDSRAGSAGVRASSSGSPTPGPDAKGDWVVPMRAKPGRKPSQEEPLTKRQAQNRASQRAFRERKQNHVATLEAKVAAYEAEKLTRDAKEEEAQRKLKSENASLTEENAGLKKKVAELEALVQQLQIQAANAAAAPPPPPPDYGSGPASWAPCNEVGCRAPSHEGPPSQRRKRPLPARASCPAPPPMTSSLDYQQQQPGSPHDNVATARFGAMSIAAASPPVVTGSSTLQLNPSSHGGWDDERGQPAALGGPSCGSSRPLPSRRESSPNLMPQNDIDMDRDCGFCTDSTPCLCRGEAILDLTGMDEDKNDSSFAPPASVDRGWMDGVDQMIKIEEEDFDDAFGPSPTYNGGSGSANNAASTAPASASATTLSTAYSVPRRPAVSISSLLSSRPKTSSRPKLWSTTSLPAALPSTGAAPTSTFTTTDPAAAPSEAGKKKLWWTKPASAQAVFSGGLTSFVPAAAPSRTAVVSTANNADSDALCSGDPSNCPACATDPALAAFCEAVGDDAASEASVSTVGPSMSLSRRGSITAASNAGDAENDNNHGGVSLYSQGREPATYGAITSPSRATGPYSSMPGYAVPLSSFRPRSTSSSLPTLRSLERTNAPSSAVANGAGYSIPDAFKQIRSHPAFPKWQGGLNLLADVVSGRAHPSSSGSSGALPSSGPSPSRPTTLRSLTAATLEMEERRARHPSVEIVPVSPRKTALIESTDRDVIHDSDHEHEGESRPRRVSISIAGGTEGDTGCLREQRARRPSLVPLSSLGAGSSSANGSSGGGDDGEHGQGRANGVLGPRGHKRRRLYLENDRVEEALRLLDWGALGNGNGSAGAKLTGRSIPLPLPSSSSTYGAQAGATSTPCSECPCPCPWARGGPAPAEGKEGEEGDGSGAGEGRGSWEEEQSRHAEAGQ